MQAEHILDVERLLPSFLLRRLTRQFEEMRPKEKKWWHIFKDVVSKGSILKDVNSIGVHSEENDILQTLESLRESMKNLDTELKSQAIETMENRKMLQALIEKNNINLDD